MNTVGALKSHTGANGRAGRQAGRRTDQRSDAQVGSEGAGHPTMPRKKDSKEAGR